MVKDCCALAGSGHEQLVNWCSIALIKQKHGALKWKRLRRQTNLRFVWSCFGRLSISRGNSVANSCAWRKDKPQINTPRLKTLGETRDRDHAMSTGEDMLMQLKLFFCG